jgi:ribosomal protein L12E/L44/L45/RPP1/RPP2
VVLASVLFALGEIVNGIRQIELTSNINEKTLKEILKYIKDSNKSSNALQESDPKENSTDDLVSEDKTEPKEEKNTNIGQECQSAEKEVSVPQQKPIVVQPTKKKDASDQAVVIVIFVTAVIVALIIGWYLLFGIK